MGDSGAEVTFLIRTFADALDLYQSERQGPERCKVGKERNEVYSGAFEIVERGNQERINNGHGEEREIVAAYLVDRATKPGRGAFFASHFGFPNPTDEVGKHREKHTEVIEEEHFHCIKI